MTFVFFNDTATTEIYTLSLHGALPIYEVALDAQRLLAGDLRTRAQRDPTRDPRGRGLEVHREADLVEEDAGAEREARSEEHTSELQSRQYLVCRLLLEKNKRISCIDAS